MIDRYIPSRSRTTNYQHERWPDVRVCRPSRERLAPRMSVSDYREIPYRSPSVNQRSSPDAVEVRKPADSALPKNFDKPMTCFFWHQFGRCNKRDVDCAYAHWDTGFMAGAPINLPGSTESVAGKNAERHTGKEDPRLADIQAREETLSRREGEIKETKKAMAKREANLEEDEGEGEGIARREEALRKAGTGA